ncbi:MAG: hypothetical protein U0165_11775 [Polyangiaceae bacterium]
MRESKHLSLLEQACVSGKGGKRVACGASAKCYFSGDGGEKKSDESRAASRGCAANDPTSCKIFGVLMVEGKGVQKDVPPGSSHLEGLSPRRRRGMRRNQKHQRAKSGHGQFLRALAVASGLLLAGCHVATPADPSSKTSSASTSSGAEPLATTSTVRGPVEKMLDTLFSSPEGQAQAGPLPRPPSRAQRPSSKEEPIETCGARASYAYVASKYTCSDGSNPFRGDAGAARDSRKGNVGANRSGHIVDLYIVPCTGGDEKVYVDMYAGCPEGTSPF